MVICDKCNKEIPKTERYIEYHLGPAPEEEKDKWGKPKKKRFIAKALYVISGEGKPKILNLCLNCFGKNTSNL